MSFFLQEKEFLKNWEESRQGRVNSWLSFHKGKTCLVPDAAPPGTSGAAATTTAPSSSRMAAAPPPPPIAAEAGGGKEKKKKKKEKKFSPMGFRPPKTKPESR